MSDVSGMEEQEPGDDGPTRLDVEFCDSWSRVEGTGPFVIGRAGDLDVDDNPYLHRTFLSLTWDRFWWLENVGASLTATVSDAEGALYSSLAPGASLPLLFRVTEVRFTAGPTSYLLTLHQDRAAMAVAGTAHQLGGTTTLQPATLTERQRAVVLALAEPSLLARSHVPSTIPSSAEAARRLGWKLSTFNRQLDAVCGKLAKLGARGLHGAQDSLASNRRSRLVEYALATRLVTDQDLALLDRPLEG